MNIKLAKTIYLRQQSYTNKSVFDDYTVTKIVNGIHPRIGTDVDEKRVLEYLERGIEIIIE